MMDSVVSASTRPWPAPVEPESARLGAQLARCMVMGIGEAAAAARRGSAVLAATAESSPLWSELSAVMLLIASFGSGSFAYQEALVATTGMSTTSGWGPEGWMGRGGEKPAVWVLVHAPWPGTMSSVSHSLPVTYSTSSSLSASLCLYLLDSVSRSLSLDVGRQNSLCAWPHPGRSGHFNLISSQPLEEKTSCSASNPRSLLACLFSSSESPRT